MSEQKQTTEEKRKPGRPKAKIDAETVFKLSSYGCTLNEIADFHKVDVNTIRRRFKDEVLKGKADIKIKLRKAQIDYAMKGNATLLIWLGKQLLNQSDEGSFDEEELLDDVDFELDEGEKE